MKYNFDEMSKEQMRLLYQKGKIDYLPQNTPFDKWIVERKTLIANIMQEKEKQKIIDSFTAEVKEETEKTIKDLINTIKI